MTTARLYQLGAPHGLRWYAESAHAIELVGAGNPVLGARLLAATSPRCAITDNLRRALRRSSPMPCHQYNLTRALADTEVSGPKVRQFSLALQGDPEAIPVDVWLARVYGISNRPTLREHRMVHARIRRAARRENLAPRDYAAAVWCGIILHTGRVPLNYGSALDALEAP